MSHETAAQLQIRQLERTIAALARRAGGTLEISHAELDSVAGLDILQDAPGNCRFTVVRSPHLPSEAG